MHSTDTQPSAKPSRLRKLEITFSETGYDRLLNHRRLLSMERGRGVPLAAALDDLIRTHPGNRHRVPAPDYRNRQDDRKGPRG